MEFKIVKQKDSPLLERERINLEIGFAGMATPKKALLKAEIAKFLKVDENLVAVRHVYTKFGECRAKAIVNMYKDAEILKKFETKKEKRKKSAKEAAK